jgi:hypothetical protein
MKHASLAFAALFVASCGKGPPTFDDGTYVAWMASGSAATAPDAPEPPPVAWSIKPSDDELRAAYPADAHGTISFAFRCQVRRQTSLGKCALTGTEPETAQVHAIGLTLADRFEVPASAVPNANPASPFALVQVAICKRASARTVIDVGKPDECIPEDEFTDKKADAVPADPPPAEPAKT